MHHAYLMCSYCAKEVLRQRCFQSVVMDRENFDELMQKIGPVETQEQDAVLYATMAMRTVNQSARTGRSTNT
jgi:hypothetical protein